MIKQEGYQNNGSNNWKTGFARESPRFNHLHHISPSSITEVWLLSTEAGVVPSQLLTLLLVDLKSNEEQKNHE